jgi:hypothetical protein
MNGPIPGQEGRQNYYLLARVTKIHSESIEEILIGTMFDLQCVQCGLGLRWCFSEQLV